MLLCFGCLRFVFLVLGDYCCLCFLLGLLCVTGDSLFFTKAELLFLSTVNFHLSVSFGRIH